MDSVLTKDHFFWSPGDLSETRYGQFLRFLNERSGKSFKTYQELYDWSIDDISSFWRAVLDFSGMIYEGDTSLAVEDAERMWPRPEWFPNITLNYAENLLRFSDTDAIAIREFQEDGTVISISYQELRRQVVVCAEWLRKSGVGPGDVVAAMIPNCKEAAVVMLAVAAIGAVWTSCSPDSGVQFVVDRFSQTHPVVLVTVDGYLYDQKVFDVQDKVKKLTAELPTLKRVLLLSRVENAALFSDPLFVNYASVVTSDAIPSEWVFERFSFSHPLAILYSSGTTGRPKPIVHSVGGTLIQHVKEHQLQANLSHGDFLFYYTTTSWMMWNWLVSGLASGVTIGLYEGRPDPNLLWKHVANAGVTAFGTSAPWISLSQKSRLNLASLDFSKMTLILSTGAPLLREHFDYIYSIKSDVQLASISGGTDIVSCFVGAGPVPVVRGRLQCVGLGMAVDVWDEEGKPVRHEQGELVCTKPFPCMPIHFLNDENDARYHASYFEKFPGIWAHGDFAILYDDYSMEILGRSDSTIKRHGVRIGTGDIYSCLEAHADILDSLAVGKRSKDNEEIALFVKTRTGELTSDLKKQIRQLLVAQSPWFKPDYVFAVSDIPYTRNGKKSEILIKNLLNGRPLTNVDVLKNPECLAQYESIALKFFP